MTILPHAFRRIRLEVARSAEFPNGSATHGYEFVAPLDRQGHIDPGLWRQYRTNCGVRRFWGEEEKTGHLLHRPGGAEHARWVFDYDEDTAYDDETGYRFANHKFEPGDYVSIVDDERKAQTFRVISVEAPI
jgi:hypothetical protein